MFWWEALEAEALVEMVAHVEQQEYRTQAVDYGGAGGNGSSNHSYAGVGGGAGNPKGAGYGGNVSGGGNGNGGVIWLIVGGNLTIGGSGVISANGNTG